MIPYSFWKSNYHPDAAALIDRMIALGETPSAATKQAINTLITTSDHVFGNWSKYEFFYMMVSQPGFVNSSKLNWKGNSAYDLVEQPSTISGMTFTNGTATSAGYETYTASAGGFSAANSSAWGVAYYNTAAFMAVGQKITVTFDLTVNSGLAPLVGLGEAANSPGGAAASVRAAAGSNSIDLISTVSSTTAIFYVHIYHNSGEAGDYTVSNITITIHPYWNAAKGWKGDGRIMGCTLNTNFNPQDNKTVITYPNISLGCMYNHQTQSTTLSSLIGTLGNGNRIEVHGRKSLSPYQRTNGNNNAASGSAVIDGTNNYSGNYLMLDAVRTENLTHHQYQNGALTGSIARTAGVLPAGKIYVCRSNISGATGNPAYIAHAHCGTGTINFAGKNSYVRDYCTAMSVTL